MTHPCSSAKPPAWCTRKRKRSKGRKMACACPAGFTRSGIMCHKGRTVKRASCKRRAKRR